MRRPVKPFVTEYRGGSRRPPGPGLSPGLDLFKTDSAPSAAPAATSTPSPSPWASPASSPSHPFSTAHSASSNGEPQEDGYEAALRAADALFSGARTASKAPASSTDSAPQGETSTSGAPSAGRILRVLDEPPSADMLEMQRLEAEHAPKKRGRKPGSKNKPKVAALVAEPIVAAAPPPARPMMSETPVVSSILPAATVATALAARAIAAAPARRPDEAPRGERYAWVRTRLKPGQQWKRRLPKVAW